ncbi:MAG: GNAT family N-acetyltransferase [Candidatus Hodarchaeales archaeon]|jgi:ribosomal protein S18 acetylase RimI-like enzyme
MRDIKKYNGDSQIRYQLSSILRSVNEDFVPPLAKRKPIDYWLNLFEKGTILYSAIKDIVIGFLVFYPELNDDICQEIAETVNLSPIIQGLHNSTLISYLHFITVAPEFRGYGIASQLLSTLLKEHRGVRPAKALRVATWSSNSISLSLYKKHGFQIYHQISNDRGKGLDSIYLEFNTPLLPLLVTK